MSERGEHGFSLVEAVIAIAILGFIVAAMVGGMATSIATSDLHRQQSEVNAVALSAAELIKAAPYVPCAGMAGEGRYVADAALPGYDPTTTTTSTTAPTWSSGLTINVMFWNGSAFDPPPGCHDRDGVGGLFPMQQVTITVSHPGQRGSSSVDILKRGP